MLEIYLLILILSFVQSLFGVGLLLFGTPIMLIYGHDYTQALKYLLPASAALSWIQVYGHRHEKLNGNYRILFFIYTIPLLVIGLFLTSEFNIKQWIKVIITVMLFVVFALRSSTKLRKTLQSYLKEHLSFFLGLMGFIHGISNMGGSILTPLATSLYESKNKVLAAISFDYAFMATAQLIVLFLIKNESFDITYLLGPIIAIIVRSFIGKRIFSFTSDVVYQRLLSCLILLNAFFLILNL